MTRISGSYFANIIGDPRAEQIRVENNDSVSDRLLIGIPVSEFRAGEQPMRHEVDFSIADAFPESGPDRDGYGVKRYRIDHISLADMDGDGYKDIYCDVTEIKRVRKKGLFGSKYVETPRHVTLFNDNIKEIVYGKLDQSGVVLDLEDNQESFNLEFRVDRLERQMRGWEYSGLGQDLYREIDRLEARIEVLEKSNSPEEGNVVVPGNKASQQELDQIKADLKALEDRIDELENVEGRVSDLESDYSDLESQLDDVESRVDDMEDQIGFPR